MPIPEQGIALVLASGGLDSSTAIALAKRSFDRVVALFVDFGQPSALAENRALQAITAHFNVQLLQVHYEGGRFHDGEIRGRNAFLHHIALLEFPAPRGTVISGIHAGTPYADCSPEFVESMQRSFDLNARGEIQVSAPFIAFSKLEIAQMARELDVPTGVTYSCESANHPCLECASCRDRRVVLGGVV